MHIILACIKEGVFSYHDSCRWKVRRSLTECVSKVHKNMVLGHVMLWNTLINFAYNAFRKSLLLLITILSFSRSVWSGCSRQESG